ncbi:ribonuclease HI, partial [Acinetobacter variabilis]
MSHTITLYVDGACRGNPGLGGWGAYIITEQQEHKIYGGEDHTTNNRMELTAAIEGIQFCPKDAKLIIYTDSNYVKQGITEWIHGWKKKNWKDVKNPDLWQKLDAICQGRDIEWHWVKGHAGHPGNEMADQLANQGADETLKKSKSVTAITENKKKSEPDWLLDDPFGLDLVDSEEELEESMEMAEEEMEQTENLETIENTDESASVTSDSTELHPQIVITPPTLELHGPRQLILDTETTGFYYQDGDR